MSQYKLLQMTTLIQFKYDDFEPYEYSSYDNFQFMIHISNDVVIRYGDHLTPCPDEHFNKLCGDPKNFDTSACDHPDMAILHLKQFINGDMSREKIHYKMSYLTFLINKKNICINNVQLPRTKKLMISLLGFFELVKKKVDISINSKAIKILIRICDPVQSQKILPRKLKRYGKKLEEFYKGNIRSQEFMDIYEDCIQKGRLNYLDNCDYLINREKSSK
jgi:hypothetical protein